MALERHKRRLTKSHTRQTLAGRVSAPGKSESLPLAPSVAQIRWADAISPQEWAIYRRAIETLRSAGVPFLLGGGFALATFTGWWRDTKDIDFYVRPQDRFTVIRALNRAGFSDYYRRLKYDRKWIYRSIRSNVIVDIIWAMANQRAQVDDLWFKGAGSVHIRGEEVHVIPKEELLWCKLYIMQRDHCDWTDVFNLVYAQGRHIDWGHLFNRLGEDTPVLKAMLTMYGWLCPKSARALPRVLWDRLGLRPPPPGVNFRRDHIRLLDSRAWFTALLPKGKKLEV